MSTTCPGEAERGNELLIGALAALRSIGPVCFRYPARRLKYLPTVTSSNEQL